MFKVKIFYPSSKLFFENSCDTYKSAQHYMKVVINKHGEDFAYAEISNNIIINRKEY